MFYAALTNTTATNLRFPGQYYDSEDGLNQNWFRDYDPTLRYIQADPIGFAGGWNLYNYGFQLPTQWIDPFGLDSQYGITFGGTVAVAITGASGGVTLGFNVPDKLTNVLGYGVFATGQVNGLAGLGLYAGAGMQLSASVTNGPAPFFSTSAFPYAEADAGYGPSIGVSAQGTMPQHTNVCRPGDDTRQLPRLNGLSISPLPRLGAGYGAFAGVGNGGSLTFTLSPQSILNIFH